MAQVGGAIHRRSARLEVCLPPTGSSDIAFGFVLRKPGRLRWKRSAVRRWTGAVRNARCWSMPAVIAMGRAVAAAELERLGALARAKPRNPIVALAAPAPLERAVVIARGVPVTALRKNPPGLQVHAVVSG